MRPAWFARLLTAAGRFTAASVCFGLLHASAVWAGLETPHPSGESVRATASAENAESGAESQEALPNPGPQNAAGSDTPAGEEKWPRPLPQQVSTLRYSEAKKLIDSRKWAEAAIVLRALLQEKPDFMPAYVNLARALAYLNRREEALTILEQAAGSAAPSDRKALIRKLAVLSRQFLENDTFQIYQEGVSFLARRKYKDASVRLARALDREADNVEILVRMGQALVLSGDHDSAAERLRTARRLNPYEPEIQLWLGRALFFRGEIGEALKELTEARRLLPRSELAPVWLAEALLGAQRRKEALDLLDRDLRKEPLHLPSLISLARIRSESLGPMAASERDNPLWLARKDLQIALSRFEDYTKLTRRGPFESELGFTPHRPNELKTQAQGLLAQVESRIEAAAPEQNTNEFSPAPANAD